MEPPILDPPKLHKPYADVGFVIPLLEEFRRLEAVFPTISEGVDELLFYKEVDLGSGLKGVAFLQDDMGKAAAVRATEALLSRYDIGVVMVVGIAGGLSSDAAIGDVCLTGTVIDVLENAKVADGKRSAKLEFNSKFYSTDHRLSFAIKYCRLGSDIRSRYEEWQLTRHYAALDLIPGEFIGRKDKNENIGLPEIHEGSIVCGSVSKSEIYNSDLRSIDRKVLAVETEAGGVFHTAALYQVPAVAIRGICDYADKNKSKLEEQTSGNSRRMAADNALTFVALQLHNHQFLRFLDERRECFQRSDSLPLSAVEGPDPVVNALSVALDIIHRRLSELSPDYHGKPRGYRLPLPRVRSSRSNATVAPRIKRVEPVSPLEAISENKCCVITIPRNYPDRSLPWVVAAELARIEIDGKQAVPIVISGEAIRPPTHGLARAAEMDLDAVHQSDNASPVIIITEFPATSRSRIDFLRREMDQYPSARLVIFASPDHNVASDSEIVILLGAQQLDVCEISFSDIAEFFERTFNLPDQEAGVVALRLREMFRRFNLNAHPSYFAGVANELLTALLRANRRAELLQLAVSGFLSFAVAADSSDVRLSRTTREDFLRRLAFEKRVMKRRFERGDIIRFTEEFAREGDYEIDPIEFIKTFQDRGLIHFENGLLEISLPFIESYLLASELVNRPREAEAYFNISEGEFDLATFDIYGELGPSPGIVKAVIDAVDDVGQLLAERHSSSRQHILLTDEIRPTIVTKQGRLADLEARLEKAFEDVLSSRSNRAEKQRMLDLAGRIEGSARDAQDAAIRRAKGEGDDAVERLAQPFRVWHVATILLGAGSERLTREPKRELAGRIVKLTSVLIDEALRAFPRVEFDQIRKSFASKETVREIAKLPDDEELTDDVMALIETIIEAYEFSLLGLPMRSMFAALGNTAGQAVLRPSVASVQSDDLMENLVARVWAAEINASKERGSLLDALADLPPTPFLRMSLSHYFMTRVFWDHWERGNRLALLDAADASIAPLNATVNKGRIKRLLDRSKGVE